MKWLLFIMQLLPTILEIVAKVEQTAGAGNGDLKKKLVMDAITAGAGAEMTPRETTAVSKTIDVVVASMKPIDEAKKEAAARPQA